MKEKNGNILFLIPKDFDSIILYLILQLCGKVEKEIRISIVIKIGNLGMVDIFIQENNQED